MSYFAYGSNLDRANLSAWCEDRGLEPIEITACGKAYLPDRQLRFSHRSATRGGGVLDVVPALGCAVEGVVLEVDSERSWTALDRKESEGHSYRRFPAIALRDGEETPVQVYEVKGERSGFVAPAAGYLDVVRRGYGAHSIDTAVLDAVARGEPHPGPVTALFVYGTLRRGQERHGVLKRHHLEAAGLGTTRGALFHLGEYPGLVRGATQVTGELYEIPDPERLFTELDEIEWFRGFGRPGSVYRRSIVFVQIAPGCVRPCWTYIYLGTLDECHEIVSGNWMDRDRS